MIMKSVRFGVLLTTLSSLPCMARGGGEHEHGEEAFEWAGIFETPESDYLWTAQKVNERYADATMILVALPVTTFTEETLYGLEEQGEHAMNLTCTDLQAGGTIVPAANTCYKLIFRQSAWQSLYNVDASSAAGIAFFAEHVPTEFEATAHYLKDDHGHDIEPKATIPDANAVTEEAAVDAGGPVLASVLVNLVTLIGVILLFPPVKRASTMPLFSALLFAFAAGALLACAFFLLLFEAAHLVATGWQAEVDVLWRWGAMILAGMVVPHVVETIFSLFMLARNPNAETPAQEVEEKGTEKTAEDLQAQFRAKARLVGAVVIGDFLHNLCDGFFIGAAFKGCGTAFGWSVAAGTILHELPQEVADFVVLTGPEVNFGTLKALAANFISGLSVLIGTAIVLSAQVEDSVIGLILAFGGGVYLHIGATDCLPKMYDPKLTFTQRLAAFGAFALGAVVIGVILIGHEHCVPEGSDGHAHGHHH